MSADDCSVIHATPPSRAGFLLVLNESNPLSDSNWEQRYQTGDTPWEKGEASPGLIDFLTGHPDLAKGTVCVPGCGTGHDARVWAGAGFDVLGVDLAPSAIRLARERSSSFAANLSLEQADFLIDPPPRVHDWVFEHTLFCAIDPSQRESYGAAVRRWLKPSGFFLAVHYLIPDQDGPPFGTTREEVLAWFSADFDLLGEWVPRSYPNRVGLERMFWWRRRVNLPLGA